MFPLYIPLFSPGFNLKGAGSKNRERSHVFLDRRLGKEPQPESVGILARREQERGAQRGKYPTRMSSYKLTSHHIQESYRIPDHLSSAVQHPHPVLSLDPYSAEYSGQNRVSPSPEGSSV